MPRKTIEEQLDELRKFDGLTAEELERLATPADVARLERLARKLEAEAGAATPPSSGVR